MKILQGRDLSLPVYTTLQVYFLAMFSLGWALGMLFAKAYVFAVGFGVMAALYFNALRLKEKHRRARVAETNERGERS